MAREDTDVADRPGDLKASVDLGEVAAPAFDRNVGRGAFRVDAPARLLDRALGDVGGVHLEGPVPPVGFHGLQEADDDRIDLFPRRAARNPHP